MIKNIKKPSKEDRKKWDLDVELGDKGEEFICELLKGGTKFENKIERKWIDTGNIAFEIKCNNKDSGLETTESHYWTHLLSKNKEIIGGFIFNTKILKENIKKYKWKTVWGGDAKRSFLVLVPLSQVYKLMLPSKNEDII
jgi:hypothetical protein